MGNQKPEAIEPAPLEDRTPGELLRETRLRHELSQKQLAIRAGTTQSAIARIEADRVSPTIRTLTSIFQVMEEDLVFGTRPREWGGDLSLSRASLARTPTQRLERGLGLSDGVRQSADQRRAAKGEKGRPS